MSEYSDALTKRILGWVAFVSFLIIFFGFTLCTLYLHLPVFLKMEHKEYGIFWDLSVFKEKSTYVTGAVATVFSIVMYMVFNPTSSAKRKRILNSKSAAINTNLENSRWMTDKERDEYFPPAKFNSLKKLKKDGIPVRAVLKNGDIHLNLASPMHCLIIGATGSGKTTTFINPMIQILGHASAGSSMIVTDPKGELFQMHSKFLKERGYDCMVLDLRDAYSSFRWNPLDSIFDLYQKYVDEGKVLYKRRDKAENSGLKLMNKPEEYGEVWHEYNDEAYANVDELISKIKITKQKYYDEAYEDLNDLCSVLCPVESKDDPVWEKGAKSIILAILLAMLEDTEDPELELTKNKFNFFNINKALSNSENNFEELKRFFCGRNPLSKAVTLSKQVLSAAETTLASYMSIAFDKMSMFNDEGLCALTSATDIDPSQIASKPTALFLKIPDEKDTRHPLAAVFVLSIYKALIKIASVREDLSLPRNVYMILDEFGNMPKIDKFDKMVTVGRSRKIWFIMVVQSYAQLENVYTKTIADIIKSNCGIKMFIGSNDIETCKEFSELCGNMTVQTASVSSGTGDKGGDVSVSQQVQTRALIYPSELQKLNNQESTGNSIIVTFGNYPLKTKFTPSYMCTTLYDFGTMNTDEQKANAFFSDKVYYHLPTRNQVLETRMKKNEENETQSENENVATDSSQTSDDVHDDLEISDAEYSEESTNNLEEEENVNQEDVEQYDSSNDNSTGEGGENEDQGQATG
ncbi:MAG: type IV secretory system conjugative DNA transfer family protein [Clostridiales bacterium]|jgi:type IV secretion system protein VirD4|nr:type IV secretory system conjugative DNA transfer family protein [Clostridiales bacterium]